MTTSQCEDGVGSPNRPEHSGLFETRTDYGLAPSFDDTRADKEVLTAELGIAHARRVSLKVVGLGANLFGHFGIGGNDGTKREHEFFDFPLVEQATLMDLYPSSLVHFVIGM